MSAWLLRIIAVFVVLAPLRADDAADRARDIAQMRKILESIQAYKRATGDVPKQLSDLVPTYLADKTLLISPRGSDGKFPNDDAPDSKLPCSYRYEFAGEGPGSSREGKKKQMDEFGEIVPILRCFLYDKVINVSHGGEVFESDLYWERAGFVKDWLERHKIDPGSKNTEPLLITTVAADGRPIAGVTITASDRSSGDYLLPDKTLTTGADGTASLAVGKHEDAGAKLTFEKAGLATLPRHWPPRDQDGNAEPFDKLALRVTMFVNGVASGVIRSAKGAPLAGVRVWLCPHDAEGRPVPGPYLQVASPTGADGRWEISDVPGGGNYKLRVNHPAHRNFFSTLGADGAPTLDALLAGKGDVTLLPPHAITGAVAAEGKPVPGATVWMSTPNGYAGASASAGADGGFSLSWLQEPKGNIIAYARGYAPRRVAIEDNSLPVAVPMLRGRPMKGRIRDQAGDPVPNVPILLCRFENTYLRIDMPVIATGDAAGNFEWRDAPNAIVGFLALLPSGAQWNFQWDGTKDKPADIRVPVQPE
jgi:hypothetical protein